MIVTDMFKLPVTMLPLPVLPLGEWILIIYVACFYKLWLSDGQSKLYQSVYKVKFMTKKSYIQGKNSQ